MGVKVQKRLRKQEQAATENIRDFEILRLRDHAREVFVNAILNPPAPNQVAQAAAQRYKEFFQSRLPHENR